MGLKNIHDRIRLYYGETYGIVIDSFPERGTVVTLSYPSDGGRIGRMERRQRIERATQYFISDDR